MPKTSITGALITLDFRERPGEPIYRQLAGHLRDAIDQGRLGSGLKLPSTRIFAKELGVSRNTILQVFEILIDEGYLTGKVGAGTFVAGNRPGGPDLAAIEPPAPVRDCGNAGYPFRTLSRRGNRLIRAATNEFFERPTTFVPDLPDRREFPLRTWYRLLSENSGRLASNPLSTVPDAGFAPLRRAIAQHLSIFRGIACSDQQVIITNGTQQSLDLICRMLIDPGDPVWIEEPGALEARAAISANGGAIYPIPVDDDGMMVEQGRASAVLPRLIFTSPSRQYPLGATLSRDRRAELVKLVQECGSWLVEDDYDSEFRYVPGAPPALYSLDTNARTIYIGSFSKILLPSFRLGYMVVPLDLAQQFAKARVTIDYHPSPIEQMALTEFIERDLLAAHIRRMRVLYRARQQEMIKGLGELFGTSVPLANTDTGVHLILPLGENADDVALTNAAIAEQIVVRPLSLYYASRRKAQGLILGFSAFNSAEIGHGLKRLEKLRPLIRPHLVDQVVTC